MSSDPKWTNKSFALTAIAKLLELYARAVRLEVVQRQKKIDALMSLSKKDSDK